MDEKDNDGNTPLHDAANVGDIETVKALLYAGADWDAENQKGDTPLYLATLNRYEEIVNILKKASYRPCTIL